MATNFPTSLDALTNPTGASSLTSPDHAGQHTDANDAIESLQAKVGVDGSAVTSSLDYKVTNINASNLASGTVPTARISGSYTGITGVGTLTVGAIPASLLTGTTLPATIVTSSLTSVGTITTGTWSGSFGAVSGANLTSLNASNISSGTLSNALLPAAATTITSVGTLTGLTVDGASSSAISLGDWSGNGSYAQVGGTSGYLLVGNNSGDTAMYLRTSTAGVVNIGANSSNTLAVGNGTSTFTGDVFTSGDFRILTASKNLIAQNPSTGTGNAAQWVSAFGVYILYRNTSTRDDKENLQPLNGIVTPSMIDNIDISLWNRKGATGFPEIGPMAEDMDKVSPFLSIKGMDCDEEGNIVPTAPSGINQNSWLSLLTLGIQDLRKRVEKLETA